jgi:hypothetical protein
MDIMTKTVLILILVQRVGRLPSSLNPEWDTVLVVSL